MHGVDAIITLGAHLADVCVKCGRKEGLTRRSFPLARHPGWLYALLGLGLLPYFLVRSGMGRGWASFCLCVNCLPRYRNAGLARMVVALPVLMWTLMFGSLRALGVEGLEEGALLAFVVSLFLFLVTAGFAWLVLSQFVGPRVLHLEEVIFREMRVRGFDHDALAECAAYAAYWANAQAHPWPAQPYPTPAQSTQANGYPGYGAQPASAGQVAPATAVFDGDVSATVEPGARSMDTTTTTTTAPNATSELAADAEVATAEPVALSREADTPAEPCPVTSPEKLDADQS